MKIAFAVCAAVTLFLFANPAAATHDDDGFAPDDDIVFVGCQDPKDQASRFGHRIECDLEAERARVCNDGTLIFIAEGEAEPATCNVTPYLEGVWRQYNPNRDDLWDPPACDGMRVYICVGAPPQFVPQ